VSEQKRPSLEELFPGQTYEETVTITEDLLADFITLSRDRALAHVDSEHACKMGFKGQIVHGFLSCLPYSRILGMFLPGSDTVIHSLNMDMVSAVYVGDTLTYRVAVDRVLPAVRTVRLKLEARNGRGEVVNRGSTTCVFRIGHDESG
jgi:acyl dehydratase